MGPSCMHLVHVPPRVFCSKIPAIRDYAIMQLSSQIPNKGESHLNLCQFTFFVQMYLCWMFKTIFMLIQMLSKWLKDMQLVHCQLNTEGASLQKSEAL